MANVFTHRSHYPRYESLRSQCLPLQLQVFNSSKYNNPQIQTLSKEHQSSMHWSLATTYTTDYRPWSQADMKASRGQNSVIHHQVAESSVPELPPLRTILKRYSIPNVKLPIPIRCCCRHSKQWRDPCLKQTGIDYWKNLSCCGIIHENEFDQSG
jgi:hypothetical protein